MLLYMFLYIILFHGNIRPTRETLLPLTTPVTHTYTPTSAFVRLKLVFCVMLTQRITGWTLPAKQQSLGTSLITEQGNCSVIN